jgi:hypothetical protein
MQNIYYKFSKNLIFKKCTYHINVYQSQKDGIKVDYQKAAGCDIHIHTSTLPSICFLCIQNTSLSTYFLI